MKPAWTVADYDIEMQELHPSEFSKKKTRLQKKMVKLISEENVLLLICKLKCLYVSEESHKREVSSHKNLLKV